MKWRAKINYCNYLFDSGEQAVAFAEDSIDHFLPDKEDKIPKVELVPIMEGEDENDD